MHTLTLLHTNDLHGRQGQVARIGTLVRQVRGEVSRSGGTCLYFDAGDCEDTVLLESALSFGAAMDAVISAAGCDQTALGNANPIRYGPQSLVNMAENFGKPILCANLVWNDGTRPAGMAPYAFHDVGDVKIGVIGMTAFMPDVYRIYNAKMLPVGEIIPPMIDELQSSGVSLIILLSHMGLNMDRNLAETISGIHVIIGGHTHDRVSPPMRVKDTLIVQAGEYGQVLGRLDLQLNDRSGRIVNYNHALIPVDESIREDERVLKEIEAQKTLAQKLLQEEIGEIRVPVTLSVTDQCSAGNLLADALLDYFPDADASMILAVHWESGLEAGVITKGGVYAANRSTGNPARVKINGEQIKTFLREGMKPEHMLQTRKPWRGHKACMPHVAGMRVVVNSNDLNDMEIYIRDKKIDPTDCFTIVTSDLEISEQLDYLPIPDDEVEFEVPTILPQVVEKYIRSHTPIADIPANRIEFRS